MWIVPENRFVNIVSVSSGGNDYRLTLINFSVVQTQQIFETEDEQRLVKQCRKSCEVLEKLTELTRIGHLTYDVKTGYSPSLVSALEPIIGRCTWVENDLMTDVQKIASLVHFEDRPLFYNFFDSSFRKEKETVIRLKNFTGLYLHVLIHFVPIFNELLEQTGAFGYFQDVTENVNSRNLLADRELALKQALHISKAGIWRYDTETERVEISDELLYIFGTPRKEALTIYDLVDKWVHTDDRQRVWDAFCASLTTGAGLDMEFRLIDLNGEVHNTRHSAVFDRNDMGMVTKIIGIIAKT